MNTRDPIVLALPTVVGVLAFSAVATAQVPNSIAAPGESVVLKVHAEGAQVYECKAGPDAKLVGSFANPLRHSLLMATPSVATMPVQTGNWPTAARLSVRSLVTRPAPTNDIPWLKLKVVAQRGNGTLIGVTTVQRINTQGGKLNGECDQAGKLRAARYAADYVFLRKN